jgi:hypothetical protein
MRRNHKFTLQKEVEKTRTISNQAILKKNKAMRRTMMRIRMIKIKITNAPLTLKKK